MVVLDSLEGNTLYYSIEEDRYSDNASELSGTVNPLSGEFVSIKLYMRDFFSDVVVSIYDGSKGTEETVVGYVSREERGVLKLYIDFEFGDNKTYDIEVNSESDELLYRGQISTGKDYIERDEQNNDLIRY